MIYINSNTHKIITFCLNKVNINLYYRSLTKNHTYKNYNIGCHVTLLFYMKLVSWNVNGLRAVCGKGFANIFAGFDADFVCLQETKLNPDVPEINYDGYQSFWNYAERKGYSGTAVFTRRKVINVTKGIGVDVHDREGRVITVETDGFYLVCVYTPNSQNELARLDYRMEWEEAFLDYVRGLDRVKPVTEYG